MFGSCKCRGRPRVDGVGLSGGEFSGEEAIGESGLCGKKPSNLFVLVGVKDGAGCRGAVLEASDAADGVLFQN